MLSGVLGLRRSELTTLLGLALPLVLAQLAQNGMSFVDTVMVGRLGPSSLAGLALGATLFSSVLVISMAVMLAVAPLVAQAVGAKRRGEAGRVTGQALWLAAALSVPGLLFFYNVTPLLEALGTAPATVALASGYLRAVGFGFPFALGFVALRGFLEGHGHARPIMFIAIGGVGLNVFLNDALIFGHSGFPRLGMVGSGYATALVYFSLFVAGALLVGSAYREERIFAALRHLDLKIVGELFRLGWPISVTLGFEIGLFSVTTLLMGRFGDAVLAGHQIALQSASTAFMVPLGVSIATGVLVGQAAGRGDRDAVRRMGVLGIALGTAFMVLTALIFWFAPRLVMSLYLNLNDPINAGLIGYAASFLLIAGMFQVVDGLQVTAQGALRGLKDTRVPMLLTLVAYWLVGFPVGLLLAFTFGLGARGLWFGMVAGLAAAAVLLSLRFAHSARNAAIGRVATDLEAAVD